MKKRYAAVIAALLAVLCSVPAFGSSELSYGIAVIRKQVTMYKCAASGEEAHFLPTDFESAIGARRISALCITSLPDRALGTLMLDGAPVYKGQILSREAVSGVTFVPSFDGDYTVTFGFSDASDSGSEYTCRLCISQGGNEIPVARDGSFSAIKGVEIFGKLTATDPDGDGLTFEIDGSGTKKGRIRLLDASTGEFSYMPNEVGGDTFSFVAVDKKGGVSDAATVTVTVEKPCGVYYADMEGMPSHTAAIKLAAAGYMTGEKVGGVSFFYPDETMSRATFLRLAMQIGGIDPPAVATSGLADDGDIMPYDKAYVACAVRQGLLTGIVTDIGTVFMPSEAISRGEAEALVGKLMSSDAVNVFSRLAQTAREDFDTPLTRADAAALLCEYMSAVQKT